MNSPGLYLYDKHQDTGKTNSISVVVSFFDNQPISNDVERSFYDVITINNMPMQKWINVIIRVQGKIVDIYINGTLTKRKEYDRIIKQNYGFEYKSIKFLKSKNVFSFVYINKLKSIEIKFSGYFSRKKFIKFPKILQC